MVTMTHEQELNLERFADLMVELIERHASVVDKQEMENRIKEMNEAGNEKFPASRIFRKKDVVFYFWIRSMSFKIRLQITRNISIKFWVNRIYFACAIWY